MKIAFFVTSLDSGGIENYLLRFLKHYDNKLQAVIVCKGGFLGELENEYRKLENVKIYAVNVGYFNVLGLKKIYSILKSENIDAVCDFTGNFAGLIMLASKIAKIKKRVVFYRGSTNHFKEDFLRLAYSSFVKKLSVLFSTQILSNSKSALYFFFGKKAGNDKKYAVVYNGINIEDFNKTYSNIVRRIDFGIPENAFVIGHTGRFDKAKNHETIIKTAKVLCEKYNDIYFILSGKNTESELKQMVSDFDLNDKIKLLGFREDVSQILKLLDIFLFPSVTEGQPNALIEAMVANLPVVTSNIEPIIETVPDYFKEKLISPFDYKKYAEIIEMMYLDRDYMNGFRCKDWVMQKYNHEKQFEIFFNYLK